MTGHPEYNILALAREYERDLKKGIAVHVPENYFEADDPAKGPLYSWQREARLFYSNWLSHFVRRDPSALC
jgi:homoserine O-succinyltransferase